MAEIKSTLELIMEKTKDLTPTDEEKKAFRKKEVQGKVKGLLVKFLDGFLDLDKLKSEIAPFEKKDHSAVMEILVHECLDRIDPEAENALPFDILQHLAGLDIDPVRRFLSEFSSNLEEERRVYEQKLSNRIREKGVSGSAVLPNLAADPDWTHFLRQEKMKFREEIQSLISNRASSFI